MNIKEKRKSINRLNFQRLICFRKHGLLAKLIRVNSREIHQDTISELII